MALMYCPECGHQVSDKANNCPNCGYPIAEFLANNHRTSDVSRKFGTVQKEGVERQSDQSLLQQIPNEPKKKKPYSVAVIALVFAILAVLCFLSKYTLLLFFFAIVSIPLSIVTLAKRVKICPIISLCLASITLIVTIYSMAVSPQKNPSVREKAPEYIIEYYSFETIQSLSFPVLSDFKAYENYYCAEPDDDHVSLYFVEKAYSGTWTTVASEIGQKLETSSTTHFTGPVYFDVCGLSGVQYRCEYKNGGLARLTCLKHPYGRVILCIYMVQDADNKLENDYDAAYTYLLEHAEMSEELPSLRNQNGSKANTKDNSSTGASELEKQSKAAFKSYKSIYEEYAKKLEKEYNNAVKEMEDAIKEKKGVDYLAEMTDKKIELFAEICDEGIEIMADKTSVFTTDDYLEWATKLTGDYMSYSTSLYGKYMSGAMDNVFD